MPYPDEVAGGEAPRLSGVYAALITPVDEQGHPDPARLADLIDFVVERGVDGLCLGGATSEYPHFSLADRKTIVAEAARHLNGRVPFVTAVGAPTLRGVLELGEHAMTHGSRALLVPMPYFYRYEQEDLAAYVRHTVPSLGAPCFLYNLPSFTNGLHPEISRALLQSQQHVVGMKDSSGHRDALALLQAARSEASFTLMCGSDGLFLDALEAGWDGGISGIASCCPEVLVVLYAHHREGRADEARRCQDLLDRLIEMVERLPFPWSIRVAAEVRGLPNGPLPYPLSDERQAQVRQLRDDYAAWFDEHLPALQGGRIGLPERAR